VSEQLRIGVLGASWYSNLRHLPALKSHPRAQTVAICDINRISRLRGDYLFIDSILEDRPISPSFYDGLKAQEVIDAAEQAHQSGCWVSLSS
jgi:predicted dehydrogenase